MEHTYKDFFGHEFEVAFDFNATLRFRVRNMEEVWGSIRSADDGVGYIVTQMGSGRDKRVGSLNDAIVSLTNNLHRIYHDKVCIYRKAHKTEMMAYFKRISGDGDSCKSRSWAQKAEELRSEELATFRPSTSD